MKILKVKDEHYIAEGLARKCYKHPNNQDLCIKIGHPSVAFDS